MGGLKHRGNIQNVIFRQIKGKPSQNLRGGCKKKVPKNGKGQGGGDRSLTEHTLNYLSLNQLEIHGFGDDDHDDGTGDDHGVD